MKRALSVELLLQWAYAERRVRGLRVPDPVEDPAIGEGELIAGFGGRGIGRVADLVADTPSMLSAGDDAVTLDLFVSRLQSKTQALLRDNAMVRSRPEWKPKARHRLAPLFWDERGGLRIAQYFHTHPDSCKCGGYAHSCEAPSWRIPAWKKGERHREYYPLTEVDSPAQLNEVREGFYVRWWAGLQVIRDSAQSGELPLTDHTVIDELPPLNPWVAKIPVDGKLSAV